MEWNIQNGDYVPNGAGSMEALKGAEAVLARVRFRLTARRGALPFLPKLGSRLHQVLRERPSARQALCAQYVAEALEEESELKVTEVILEDGPADRLAGVAGRDPVCGAGAGVKEEQWGA